MINVLVSFVSFLITLMCWQANERSKFFGVLLGVNTLLLATCMFCTILGGCVLDTEPRPAPYFQEQCAESYGEDAGVGLNHGDLVLLGCEK